MNPTLIVRHHTVAILYLDGPILYPRYRWGMGACLSVEINTFFLIARRVAYLRRDSLHPIVPKMVNASFYITWILV